MRWLFASFWLLCALTASAQTADQPPQPTNLSAKDLVRGKQLFEAQCAPCHGMLGTGGKGASLIQPKLKHAADDAALFSVIRHGIEDTEMPGAWQMTDHEIWLVVAYVRSLGRVAVEKLSGNAEHGRSLFAAHGCGGCHIVDGVGGTLGPDLSEVGARRSSQRLRQALIEPGKALPEGFMVLRVMLADGAVLQGIRVNEDSFTIQVRDYAGNFRSLRKQQLRKLEYKADATPMPTYKDKLTPEDTDDLVAYLASLRGRP